MKRVVDVLYGLKGYPNSSRFTEFKTDLFANGDTPCITVNKAGTSGFSVTSAVTNGINIAGVTTNAINIPAAASVTNFIKFNALTGCILPVDVNPKEIPSGGGLGADACIRIMIGSADYFIPIFAVELS